MALVPVVCCILGIAEHFVITFKGEAILPGDILALGTAMEVSEGYEFTFTAGIGENDWSIRKAFCDCFEWLGVRIDNNKNREAVGNGPQVISAAGSAVTVMVIPTDEEYMIAHDVERLTANN